MLLSLRSGIDTEIGWALDRLCRLCDNEQFVLRAIPGLTDVLFEWPEWFVKEGYKEFPEAQAIFAPSPRQDRKQRHALESLFILRNAALNEPNALELAGHPRTRPLILMALHNLGPDRDENVEFILHAIELLHAIASTFIIPPSPPPETNPLSLLEKIANTSSNRSLIITSLMALTLIYANPQNAVHLTSTSPALFASIRYLPLFIDKPLVDACLDYLYTHISQPAMVKAFLLQREMPATLKILVNLLLSEQVEETVTLDVGGTVHAVPALTVVTRDHELSKEELDALVVKPEPQRCYEWY
jgi:chromatin structure-remodeling complex subunit RSC9